MEKLLMWLIELLREIRGRRGKNEKDLQYLCAHLVVSLERYVDSCAAVVGDDGLCCGQPDKDGYHVAQVDQPKLGVDPYNQELKLLPTPIMHALVQFPRDIEIANAKIDGASEHATPPEYEEAFEERQYQYAKLGLEAQELASELRTLAAMSPREFGEWSIIEYIKGQMAGIEEYRIRRAEANSKLWESLRETSTGGE
ncbi:hypothetical protein [Marinobacter caseinilyticus]|uniref:hypothetical protein n=1 Tax=Marinobacter caseinilyticus TaxID=2692195 RepID=UPI001409ED1B|nr:hypothetical protein [Marinobacter caseinilyticus]